MKFTDDEKKLILERYLAWVNQVSDDLEDKEYFYPSEIVYNVIRIIEELE